MGFMERDMYNSWVGGVCSGLSDYTGIDRSIIRVLTVVSGLFSFGWSILIYLLLWVIIPSNR